MGNPLRGEVAFDADGETYMIVYTIDTLCQLEDRFEQDVGEIIQRMRTELRRLGFLRVMLWAGLREKHPEIDEQAAGELVVKIGMVATGALLLSAITQAFPPPQEAAKRTGGPRKRKAAAPADGTGGDSSGSGSS